jgi:hypothetical protein
MKEEELVKLDKLKREGIFSATMLIKTSETEPDN